MRASGDADELRALAGEMEGISRAFGAEVRGLGRVTAELAERARRLRMRPFAEAFEGLPRVVREIPHFDLRVAGSISAHVAASPNITRLGWIDDVHEAYAQAPLSVGDVLAHSWGKNAMDRITSTRIEDIQNTGLRISS